MANIGKVFEGEIRKFLEQEYLLVLRPIDIVGQRFTIKKKFDYACLDFSGCFIGIEAKCTRAERFDFARIREHQRENLSKIASTKYGRAYLALNFRDAKGPGKAWLIPWKSWLDFAKGWPKKSIRCGEAQQEFWKFELERVTSGWVMPNVHGPRLKLI